ncbi:MAG TPA: hypothetical protein VFC24_00830 [Casimicrobiaceae bacterium]|nr:hypothetical protein [Casimicrobiaceae bacterium]
MVIHMLGTARAMQGAVALAAMFALAGCQQERNTNAPVTSVRDVPAATAAAATTSEPAKVPAGDPSLPPASTTLSSSSDGAQTALTKGERTNAQPLEGQANNYSSDAFAKRGNDDVPRGSPDAPRGNDAVSTPNSYPKDSK